MERKYIPLQFNSKFEKVNDEFVKTTISVMSYDQIANGVKFTKDSIIEAIPTLNYCPVIGYFNGDNFEGHAQDMVISDSGIDIVVKTIPFGVVIKDSQRFEKIQKANGEFEEYLVCDAYLWSRYEEAVNKVCENECNQSMEVLTTSTKWQEDYLEINSFNFSGLCILGDDVTPAFNLAKIRTSDKFSKSDFKDMYSEMTTSLDKFLNFEKGGDKVEENKLNNEAEEVVVEENVEGIEEVSTEPIELSKGDTEENLAKKRQCSCGFEIETVEEFDENKEFVCDKCMSEKEFKDLSDKYSSLEVEYGKLQKEFSTLEEEAVALRDYKKEKEFEIRKSEEEKIFSKFEELSENEDFTKLKEESANYSLEELENKCFAVLGKVKFSAKKKPKKTEEKQLFNLVETPCDDSITESKHDLIIKKYLNK